jgi:antitoxin ParD1/3/4/toxin ParE1/3/4
MIFLAGMPGAGHVRPDLTGDPVKFWQVFSYLIVYDPVPRPIHIVRVLHASRDIAAILRSTT